LNLWSTPKHDFLVASFHLSISCDIEIQTFQIALSSDSSLWLLGLGLSLRPHLCLPPSSQNVDPAALGWTRADVGACSGPSSSSRSRSCSCSATCSASHSALALALTFPLTFALPISLSACQQEGAEPIYSVAITAF
jgi:hypothetical protein